MIDLKIKTDKFFCTGLGKRYISNFKQKLISACDDGMRKAADEILEKVRDDVSRNLKVKKKGLVKSFVAKIYSGNKNKIPSVHFYSRVPFMGTHDKGAKITGRIFIPFTLKPLGFKTQKLIFEELRRNGNLFADEKKGSKTILFAINNKKSERILAPFKRLIRSERIKQRQNGAKVRTTIKQDERVNLGILVKQTKLPKRLNFTTIIASNVNKIVDEVEKAFKD